MDGSLFCAFIFNIWKRRFSQAGARGFVVSIDPLTALWHKTLCKNLGSIFQFRSAPLI
jgi:hypothetical protein